MHDILIRNGHVVDGTGKPSAPLDVAIDGSRIAGLYKRTEGKAAMVMDAKGKIVCPGFIDIHSHSELGVLACPLAESSIRQGVTTELVGNCGTSPAPALGNARDVLKDYGRVRSVEVGWVTLDEYLLRLADVRTSVNIATLTGAETLRRSVIGPDDQQASPEHLEEMKRLLAETMLHGSYGLSSGLIYAPGCFASTEELIALATVASAFEGIYTSHIRGEGRTLMKAVREAITIGREAHVRVEVSHHKACGPANFGQVIETIRLMESARAEGVDIAFDVYPYTASCTSLDSTLPPWARDGSKEEILSRLRDRSTRTRISEELKTPSEEWENSVAEIGWDKIVLIGLRKKENRRFENRSVQSVADEMAKTPDDTAFDLMIDEDLMVSAIFHDISEEDMRVVLAHPLASVGADGESQAPYLPSSREAVHPRSYGTFPRVLGVYAVEKGLLSIEEAVRKMTSWPAERIGFSDRGVLAKGMAADVVVFDPKRIRDRATFEESHKYPQGIDYVIVNGAITIENGEHTKERAGQVLRHKPAIA